MQLKKRNVALAAHAHQPLRVRAGTTITERQTGPGLEEGYRNYSEKCGRECYLPVAFAGLDGSDGVEEDLVNLFQLMSVATSEHLLDWLQRHMPLVYEAWLAGHAYNLRQFGHGNVICEVEDHVILTLLDKRQRRRQLQHARIAHQHRLGESPKGFWAAEGCINLEVLKDAFDLGYEYSIVRFHQIEAWQFSGSDHRHQHHPNHRYPHRVHLGDGRWFTLFIYDDEVSKQMARDNLLASGEHAYWRVKDSYEADGDEPQVVFTHFDLETLGHHWHLAEKGYAYCAKRLAADPDLHFSNLTAIHEGYKELWAQGMRFRIAHLPEQPTSWSCFCPEGDSRWKRHCGHTEGGGGRSQHWRAELKAVTDTGLKTAYALYDEHGPGIFNDLNAAEEAYKLVLLNDSSQESLDAYFAQYGKQRLTPLQRRNGVRLQEILRWTHAAKTSCGWFFDELSRPEGVQNLRFLMYALQLMRCFGIDLEPGIVTELAKAPSNIPMFVNGAGVWEQRVINPQDPESVSMLHIELDRILDELTDIPEVWLLRRLRDLLREFHVEDKERRIARRIRFDPWIIKNRVIMAYRRAVDNGHLQQGDTSSELHQAFVELAGQLRFSPRLLGWRP